MSDFTLTATVAAPYERALEIVRAALADAGFGVLTEIDLRATLKSKLGVETAPQVILGACRPELAYAALQADPRIATLLPCNVVVSSAGPELSRVSVFDPGAMGLLSGQADLAEIIGDARQRITHMLRSLNDEEADDAIGAR